MQGGGKRAGGSKNGAFARAAARAALILGSALASASAMAAGVGMPLPLSAPEAASFSARETASAQAASEAQGGASAPVLASSASFSGAASESASAARAVAGRGARPASRPGREDFGDETPPAQQKAASSAPAQAASAEDIRGAQTVFSRLGASQAAAASAASAEANASIPALSDDLTAGANGAWAAAMRAATGAAPDSASAASGAAVSSAAISAGSGASSAETAKKASQPISSSVSLADLQAQSAANPREENPPQPESFFPHALPLLFGLWSPPSPQPAARVEPVARADAWPPFGAGWPVALMRMEGPVDGRPGWQWARVAMPIRDGWPAGTPVALRTAADFSAPAGASVLALMGPAADNSGPPQARTAQLTYAAQGNAFNALRIQRWALAGETRNASAQGSLAMAGILALAAMLCMGARKTPLSARKARLGLACSLMGLWCALSYLSARDLAMAGAADIFLLGPPVVFCVIGAFLFVARWPRRPDRF